MPIHILMPALSPTMSEGKLAKWLKREGDAVASGDAVAEIETDKATMEVEVFDDGVLGKILVAAGTEGVAVNTPIAVILEEGEDASAIGAPPPPPQPPPKSLLPQPQAAAAPPSREPGRARNGRVFASPLARRLAHEAGLDLTAITGSGPRRRIVKRDIEMAREKARSGVAAAVPGQAYTEVPHTTMRKVIAERLAEAKRAIPHFYLTIDCRIDKLLEMRKVINAKAPEGEGAYKLSLNDFVVKAVALALKEVPEANASWNDDAVRLYSSADIAIAVATPGGLITPVVRAADAKGLVEISNEIKGLAARAREGKLAPEEYRGGGFTISNLGMYGIKSFSAIINPPQSCILAVGAAERRPVAVGEALGVATVMTCTLSVDHRSVDGAVAANFLAAFKGYAEEPLTMLLQGQSL